MIKLHCKRDPSWLRSALGALASQGYCIVEGALDAQSIAEIRSAMYRAKDAILQEIGVERLRRAGEVGVLRLMMKFEPSLLRILELPELLALVDATVSPTAILHLQNGFILPSQDREATAGIFQTTFHRDFPRYLHGYLASMNILFAIDPFSRDNGATFVVPASHQKPGSPPADELRNAVPAECDSGAMLVFDSTLWHAAGANTSGRDRLAINHQFTRSWIKQQIDYIRALGEKAVLRQPPRTQQLLGWYTRVVTSLDDYYRPPEERLYRRGQG